MRAIGRGGIWLCALVLLGACGGDDDDEGGACGPESPLSGTPIDDIGKLAQIAVQDRLFEGNLVNGTAIANFLDFTPEDSDPSPTLNFDFVCSTVVGEPDLRVPADRLQVPSAAIVTIDGSGTSLAAVGEGRMQATGLALISAGSIMTVFVEGGSASDEFPSFDMELEGQDLPQDPSIRRGDNGELILRWTPAGADAIEVELWVLEPGEGYHPVRCVVADDGCLTVSTEAATYAFEGATPVPLEVRLSSVKSTQWDGPDGEIGFFKLERRNDVAYQP